LYFDESLGLWKIGLFRGNTFHPYFETPDLEEAQNILTALYSKREQRLNLRR